MKKNVGGLDQKIRYAVGSGGRKKQVKNIYKLKVNLLKYKTDYYKWEAFFKKANKGRESELKYFEIITEAFRTFSNYSFDIEFLFNWLAAKINSELGYKKAIENNGDARIILHFQKLNIVDESSKKLEQPEGIF